VEPKLDTTKVHWTTHVDTINFVVSQAASNGCTPGVYLGLIFSGALELVTFKRKKGNMRPSASNTVEDEPKEPVDTRPIWVQERRLRTDEEREQWRQDNPESGWAPMYEPTEDVTGASE